MIKIIFKIVANTRILIEINNLAGIPFRGVYYRDCEPLQRRPSLSPGPHGESPTRKRECAPTHRTPLKK
jgi:hypothetical protein